MKTKRIASILVVASILLSMMAVGAPSAGAVPSFFNATLLTINSSSEVRAVVNLAAGESKVYRFWVGKYNRNNQPILWDASNYEYEVLPAYYEVSEVGTSRAKFSVYDSNQNLLNSGGTAGAYFGSMEWIYIVAEAANPNSSVSFTLDLSDNSTPGVYGPMGVGPTYDVCAPNGAKRLFKFTPEVTAEYTFVSTNYPPVPPTVWQSAPCIRLLNSNGSVIKFDTGTGQLVNPNSPTSPRHVNMTVQLTAGQQYILEAYGSGLSEAYFRLTVTAPTITLDANGGSLRAPPTKIVTPGSAYGELPTPVRLGYNFNGWYTAAIGGTRVTSDSIVPTTGNHTLFAQWTMNVYELSLGEDCVQWNRGTDIGGFVDYYSFTPKWSGDYNFSGAGYMMQLQFKVSKGLTQEIGTHYSTWTTVMNYMHNFTHYLEAGVTYYIEVSPYGNRTGSWYNIKVNGSPPPNSHRIVVNDLGQPHRLDLVWLPRPTGPYGPSGQTETVKFEYSPVESALHEFEISDYPGTQPSISIYDSNENLLTETGSDGTKLRATLIAGETYYIAISLYNAEAGNFNLKVEAINIYEQWKEGVSYTPGQTLTYGVNSSGAPIFYTVLQAHTSMAHWLPNNAPSLYKQVEFPQWVQPLGSTDAYAAGDKVLYNGVFWVSNVDANVWAPGVFGWTRL